MIVLVIAILIAWMLLELTELRRLRIAVGIVAILATLVFFARQEKARSSDEWYVSRSMEHIRRLISDGREELVSDEIERHFEHRPPSFQDAHREMWERLDGITATSTIRRVQHQNRHVR